jgi:hypothetical protein
MKTLFLAAAAALSLGIGSAYASDSEGQANQSPITRFTEIPGVVAQVPGLAAPSVATAQSGQAVHAFVTSSRRGVTNSLPAPTTRAATTNQQPRHGRVGTTAGLFRLLVHRALLPNSTPDLCRGSF